MKIVDEKNLNIPNDLKNFNEMLGNNVFYDNIKSQKTELPLSLGNTALEITRGGRRVTLIILSF